MASRLFDDLMDRRVPQYLAVYLGASWGIIEFFAFMEERFLWSPHLTNLILVLLALLFPSVALFVYFHGRQGRDRWRRLEKVFIPTNVVVALLVLFAGFSGKQLGAVTHTVVVEDEEGNDIEREVPKAQFRRRLALFPVQTGEGVEAWMGDGLVTALSIDLFQDLFLDVRPPTSYNERLKELDSTAATAPPALKRQVADDYNLGYFVDGHLDRTGGEYQLDLVLHEARTGRVLAERTTRETDFFALVDSASVQLRRDLDLPARHLEESPDLPVTELGTESLDAYRHYTAAMHALGESDYATASADLRAALEIDPAFATASLNLYGVDVYRGQTDSARLALQRTLDHLYRLPERLQFAAKGEWYGIQQDYPKMFSLYEMWSELYPQDLDAQLVTAQLREVQNDVAGAIEKLEQALELDPTRHSLLPTIATRYRRLGRIDEAESYLVRYAEQLPERAEPQLELAELRQLQGRHADARENLDRAMMLDPRDVSALTASAELHRDVGEWKAAESDYAAALEAARTPAEREEALWSRQGYHSFRHAYGDAADDLGLALEQTRLAQPPIYALQRQLIHLGDLALAGREDEARETLAGLEAQLTGPPAMVLPFGRVSLLDALGRPDELEGAVEDAEAMVEASGFRALTAQAAEGRGRLHELRGEWRKALAAYERQQAADPAEPSVPTRIGRVYRELGELEKAEEMIQKTLSVVPAHGRANYELGRVYDAMKRPDLAVPRYEQAVGTWALAPAWDEVARDAQARLEAARLQLRAVRPGG